MLDEILQHIRAEWFLKTMRDGQEYKPIWDYFEEEIITPTYNAAIRKKRSEQSK